MSQRIQRSVEQWQTLFAQHEQSGLSANAFCQQQGLCPKHFSLRRRQLAAKRTETTTTATKPFVKAVPQKMAEPRSAIVLRSSVGEFHFPTTTSADWLATFCKAMT